MASKDRIAIYVGRIERKPERARVLFSLAGQFFMVGGCKGESQSYHCKLQETRTQLTSILQRGSSESVPISFKGIGDLLRNTEVMK